ncbi:MAG: hypothetical protein NC325_01840 [Anaeroplasma bactoclasticum]|nr:hypothetical protein [Anaeroplasma bactoclasticum]
MYVIMDIEEVILMQNTNITSARSELFKLAASCIKYNNVININTKDGNVIMLSEEDYNSLLETLYLSGIPGMYESIIEGANTPLEECEKLEWK